MKLEDASITIVVQACIRTSVFARTVWAHYMIVL